MKTQSFVPKTSRLVLEKIQLSENPEAKVEKDADGIGGKINVASDDRKYFIALFRDANNPFNPARTRVISQSTSSAGVASWRLPSPKQLTPFIGKEVPGGIVTRMVDPYVIGDRAQPVESYSCVVFDFEPIEMVFAKAGHAIQGVTIDGEIELDPVVATTGAMS